ncbi:MAG: hypothetical protein RL189_972 [Pseudomonadota bacterium]|jgi:hypothetical protein
MKTFKIFAILPLLVSCGVDSDFTAGSNTGVVITKNPKGQAGGSTEVKQMELLAPWLAESSELYLEIKSVNLVDNAGQRETVGVADAGTYLLLTRSRTGKVEFYLAPDQMKSAKSVELVVENSFAKRSGKSLASYTKSTTLTLAVAGGAAQVGTGPLAAYTSAAYAKTGTCSLSVELSSSPVATGVSEKCGGELKSDSGGSGDDSDDEDNKSDDDKDNND